jgi:hypothetical protein
MTITNDAPVDDSDLSGGGQDLIMWAFTERCTKVVRSELKKAGLPSGPEMVEDVAHAVWQNIELHVARNPEQKYDNVRAYGRTVVRNTMRRVARGKLRFTDEDLTQFEGVTHRHTTSVEDSTRVYLEQQGGPAWQLGAALAYLTLVMYPDSLPEGLPAPQAGAAPATAIGWPALWLAGVRDCFPGDGKDTKRKRRNRSVTSIRERVATAGAMALRREV